MGIKRTFEEESYPEPSFKLSKHLDHNKKMMLHTDEFPSDTTTPSINVSGEAKSNLSKSHFVGKLEDGDTDTAYMSDKELETSAPLSLVTSSSSEEDAGNGKSSFWSYFPDFIDLSIPRRPIEQFEDPYISLLNGPPRKEVPIGPDHQAELPSFSGSYYLIDSVREQKLMGTCIIPMPDLSDSTIGVGRGRTDCKCLDVGSMRCVQQHVKEAREKLRESIGEESFAKLGFYNMGDEVGCKWTLDDERVFHEVVFSNPVSEGRNFWKHLTAAFPTRPNKEIVNYYFNVFMLHRRAVQNRSHVLEIDSDDDEEQKGVHGEVDQNGSHLSDIDTDNEDDVRHLNGNCYVVGEDEEDSTIESFDDQDLDSSWVDDFWSDEPGNGRANVGSDVNYGNSDGNAGKQDVVTKDGGNDISGQEIQKSNDETPL